MTNYREIMVFFKGHVKEIPVLQVVLEFHYK